MFFIDTVYESDDRYDFAKFLDRSNSSYDPLTSKFLFEIKKIELIGSYVVQSEESRPDLLSFNIYGDTQYWWVLLHFNDILDYRDIVSGNVIKFPSLEAMEDLYFSLKSQAVVNT